MSNKHKYLHFFQSLACFAQAYYHKTWRQAFATQSIFRSRYDYTYIYFRFGPAGNSDSFYAAGYKRTADAPAYLRAMGLDALEYSFGRGVRMSPETAQAIREAAQAAGSP